MLQQCMVFPKSDNFPDLRAVTCGTDLFPVLSQVNQTPDSCQNTKFKVINLDDGALYRFRVMAVNAAGESDPANVKEPVRVLDRLGWSPLYPRHLYCGPSGPDRTWSC